MVWFGRPIEPRPNWRQMELPVGTGFGTESDRMAEEERLLAAHDPPLDLDELPGWLHAWYRLDGCWFGSVRLRFPVHGEGMSLSAFLDSIPADRLRPDTPAYTTDPAAEVRA